MPEGALQEAVSADQSGALDLYARILREGAAVALAAEFKRCSSKGDIAVGVDAGSQARAYVRAGASVVSVLTEPKWFKGSLEDLRCVRDAVGAQAESERRPRAAVLRKDFIIDAYQLLEVGSRCRHRTAHRGHPRGRSARISNRARTRARNGTSGRSEFGGGALEGARCGS